MKSALQPSVQNLDVSRGADYKNFHAADQGSPQGKVACFSPVGDYELVAMGVGAPQSVADISEGRLCGGSGLSLAEARLLVRPTAAGRLPRRIREMADVRGARNESVRVELAGPEARVHILVAATNRCQQIGCDHHLRGQRVLRSRQAFLGEK
jgi:hypothetical protein